MTTSHGKVIPLSSRAQRLGLKLSNIIVWSAIVGGCLLVWAAIIKVVRQ